MDCLVLESTRRVNCCVIEMFRVRGGFKNVLLYQFMGGADFGRKVHDLYGSDNAASRLSSTFLCYVATHSPIIWFDQWIWICLPNVFRNQFFFWNPGSPGAFSIKPNNNYKNLQPYLANEHLITVIVGDFIVQMIWCGYNLPRYLRSINLTLCACSVHLHGPWTNSTRPSTKEKHHWKLKCIYGGFN